MFDIHTLHRGEDNKFHATDLKTNKDVVIEEMFSIEDWDCPEAFKMAGVRGYEPMTAKELETDEQQDEKFKDTNYFFEEKFDGTRALVYFLSQQTVEGEHLGYCRVFSRRVSKKTGFYVENTDSLPHIREIDIPELAGTILDGEMFIDGLPFKEVSSTLNCLWDKAIDRQIEKGFITFHAFDILFYHGIDLRNMPLERRKVYLHLAVEEAQSPHIKEVQYYECGRTLPVDVYAYELIMSRISIQDEDPYFDFLEDEKESYPNLYKCLKEDLPMTPRAFYEIVVSTGGEGLIVKPKNGKYHHKRGWEYSKVKKFLTRDLIVVDFSEPTKEYTGKEIKKWGFWEEVSTGKKVIGNFYGNDKYIPITKHYFNNQVGNLLLGVLISIEDFNKIPKNKQGVSYMPTDICPELRQYDTTHLIMEVCECSGFDDETREYFTRNKNRMIGTVIEVKANELFKDSGKMRHPRFNRMRFDKEPERCMWLDHIGR